jgi:hypothetical protein
VVNVAVRGCGSPEPGTAAFEHEAAEGGHEKGSGNRCNTDDKQALLKRGLHAVAPNKRGPGAGVKIGVSVGTIPSDAIKREFQSGKSQSSADHGAGYGRRVLVLRFFPGSKTLIAKSASYANTNSLETLSLAIVRSWRFLLASALTTVA